MDSILVRSTRALAVFLGVVTMAGVGVLLAWDGNPAMFPPRTHDYVAAFALATIAIAYLAYLASRRPPWREVLKGLALAIAFLFWAANQYWPNLPQAMLFNDLAIALFVLDVFLVIVGWPRATEDGFVEIGGILGGIVPHDPEGMAAEVIQQPKSAMEPAYAFEEGSAASHARRKNRIQDEIRDELEGNAVRIIGTVPIRREGNLGLLSLLLGIATGLAGLNYLRLKAKR